VSIKDRRLATAFGALCANYRTDPDAVHAFLDGQVVDGEVVGEPLDREDTQVLAITVGRWFAKERARTLRLERQLDQLRAALAYHLDDDEARQLMVEEAQTKVNDLAMTEETP
jgi:hypothetical protein